MRCVRGLKRFLQNREGGVSATMALMLVPLIGILGIAVEGSSWLLTQRAAQNGADSAAVAAAINACASGDSSGCYKTSATYDQVAKSVASQFGFVDGASHTTVSPSKVTCPDGTTGCYQVSITRTLPLYMVGVVGFAGNTTLSGSPAQSILAVSIAKQPSPGYGPCITALGNSSSAISINGAGGGGSTIDFGGCNFLAPNGGASCTNKAGTKTNIGISEVSSAGDSKDCGTEQVGSYTLSDNYHDLYKKLTNPCKSYPTANKKTGAVAPSNQLQGSMTFSASTPICGDAQVTGAVTVTKDSVLVIENGRLDLNNLKISTATGAHLTIVFSGTASSTNSHVVYGNGTLDYSAPNDGSTWSGVALYQDPNLTSNVDFTYSGNNPAFDITGLIYAPNSNVTMSGAINHATAGYACLAFMVKTFQISGTVDLFAKPTSECDRAGVSLPSIPGAGMRAALVQ